MSKNKTKTSQTKSKDSDDQNVKESDDQFDQIRKRILDMESERVMKEKDIHIKIEDQK